MSSFGVQSRRKAWTCWNRPRGEAEKVNSWTEHLSGNWSLKELGFFSQEEKRLPEILIDGFQYLKGAMENGDKIFSRVCCDRMKSTAHSIVFSFIALIWPQGFQTRHCIPSRTWHLPLLYSSAFWHLQSIFACLLACCHCCSSITNPAVKETLLEKSCCKSYLS